MSQMSEGNTRSFLNKASATERALRVKVASGLIALAGLADREWGTMLYRCEASEHATVLLRTASGTCQMVAADSFAVGATLYTAANGKVSDTQGTGAFAIGVALEAASGDGSIVEVLRSVGDETAGS